MVCLHGVCACSCRLMLCNSKLQEQNSVGFAASFFRPGKFVKTTVLEVVFDGAAEQQQPCLHQRQQLRDCSLRSHIPERVASGMIFLIFLRDQWLVSHHLRHLPKRVRPGAVSLTVA